MKKVFALTLLALATQTACSTSETGVGAAGVALPSNPSFTQSNGVAVTMDNVIRAETAKYFAEETRVSGGNKFRHERNGIDLNNQTVIRSNFDLVYSYGVFDTTGGLTISVPDYDLYQSVHVFDEDHFTVAVVYPGETKTIQTSELSHGKHVYLFMRTQPRAMDDKGLDELHQRQDSVKVTFGTDNPQPYKSDVQYDLTSFNNLRNDLVKRGPKEAVIYKGFVSKGDEVITPQYQLVNIGGWGGLPAKHAFYWVVAPQDEAAQAGQCSSTTFKQLPVQYDKNGYWSLTAYNQDGWVKTEQFKIDSHTAVANKDGSYTLHFNCGADAVNNIEVKPHWNALMRAYLPTSLPEILSFSQDMMKNSPVVSQTK
ncbi:DUF1214 domain-containing protein [Vibrio sp. CK2-1]|uniref:DUF1214 domain-containing protein n=1 Tax=Vibrio sp. CK2-1 TaxID=2912249 RepID=UPI001F35F690|nr:DUF1214 domain-containing protein [Vibrio sp. CK2-1]MCF7354422.1 DUF1214 domain-containing protein [Vibrio sp. CK2-1]